MKANTQRLIAAYFVLRLLISCTSSTTATSSNARVTTARLSPKTEKRWPYAQVLIR